MLKEGTCELEVVGAFAFISKTVLLWKVLSSVLKMLGIEWQ